MPSSIAITTLQATGLSTVSNVLAQLLEAHRAQRPFSLDAAQLFRFVVLCLLTTPPNYLWQQQLERTFPAYPKAAVVRRVDDVEKGGTGLLSAAGEGKGEVGRARLSIKNTLAKWFADCITLGAIVNTAAFLVLMGMMKRQTVAQIGYNLRTETVPIIVAGYKIWPLASIVSFGFVPVDRRIVFLNCIGLLWGIYMSMVAARV
ncbi:hypothetical protein NKR23_g9 [Pleurostoma richardsiae]|uniref:Uncharacterized protein n=1 Tax=Pleurostoma richardsiae TaxID=41990 RepID=A0AA38S6R5_9PEZI|nr:hypothetical protein NKR23_g9 [Pleurostoma richardsiae]